MDRKKFGHIFYTLTYLPIQKIWTNLEKSLYLIWPLEIYICQFLAYVQNIFLKASIYELNSRITPSTDLLIILKAMFQEDKTIGPKKGQKLLKKYGHSSLTYLPSKNLSKFFFGKKLDMLP